MVLVVTDREVYEEKKVNIAGWLPFLTLTKPEKIDIVVEVANDVERFYKMPDSILIMKTALLIPIVRKWSKEEILRAIEYDRFIRWGVLWLYVRPELLDRAGYRYVEDFASWFRKLLRFSGYEDP